MGLAVVAVVAVVEVVAVANLGLVGADRGPLGNCGVSIMWTVEVRGWSGAPCVTG